MKKVIPTTLFATAAVFVAMSFTIHDNKVASDQPQEEVQADFPEDIHAMLETSCYDCHISESSNLKAKGKLNFSKWSNMSAAKKVGKLENIAEVVKKGDMPPKRYLEKNPAAALSQEQVDAIVKWTAEETNKLMGEGK